MSLKERAQNRLRNRLSGPSERFNGYLEQGSDDGDFFLASQRSPVRYAASQLAFNGLFAWVMESSSGYRGMMTMTAAAPEQSPVGGPFAKIGQRHLCVTVASGSQATATCTQSMRATDGMDGDKTLLSTARAGLSDGE